MYIRTIKLENFRSYEKYTIDFEQTTILIGPNGIGKTNILESIWILASGRSWRTSHDGELIQWDKDYAKVTAQICNSKDKQLELLMQKSETQTALKRVKINDVKHRLIDLLGEMPTVMFSPEAIEMISGPPGGRRRYLDILLSQLTRSYALNLLQYGKVLKERNRLLEAIKNKRAKIVELDFWDEKLAENGTFIICARKKALNFINLNINKVYNEISGKHEKIKIIYRQSINEDNFLEHLVAQHERDIEQQTTTGGPHRDDFEFRLDDKDLSTFGSRGEFRSAVLALKILELRYLETENNRLQRFASDGNREEKPILLLDDIFSELDAERRHHLAKIVSGQQTIISTTDLDHIEKGLREKAKIVKIGKSI